MESPHPPMRLALGTDAMNLIQEKPLLEENIAQADLDDLLAMKLGDNDPLNEKIMPYLVEKIEEASLEELIEVRRKDRSLNEIVEPTLKIRIDEADLSELLEALQWTTRRDREEITSKFEDHQIYNSFYCPSAFCSLFRESVERCGSVQHYWLSFRKNLDKFGSDEYIDKLKHVIDSYPETA